MNTLIQDIEILLERDIHVPGDLVRWLLHRVSTAETGMADLEYKIEDLTEQREQALCDGLTHQEIIQACENIGYDLTCGVCACLFYTGIPWVVPHDAHCKTRNGDGEVEVTFGQPGTEPIPTR